jgi:hypothetical protein
MALPIEDRGPVAAPKTDPGKSKPAPAKNGGDAAKKAAKAAQDAVKKATDAAKKAVSGSGGGSTAGKEPSTQAETAANFGYTLAFFNSNPELKALLKQATDGGWTQGRFVAALQNTNWFRHSSESYRKYIALKSGDPATFNQQITEGTNRVLTVAQQMGANVSPNWAKFIADTALKMGWGEDHLKRYLMTQLSQKNGNYTMGQAAALQSQYRGLVEDYGVNVSDTMIGQWVRAGVLGAQTPDSVKNYVQQLAASKYVALKDRIMSGETVRQIADPYVQTYGKLLETNSENVNLDDPLIQRALQAKDAKGKPTTQTLYDFENTLRNDPRWAKTNNARDTMSSTANAILKSFGVVS